MKMWIYDNGAKWGLIVCFLILIFLSLMVIPLIRQIEMSPPDVRSVEKTWEVPVVVGSLALTAIVSRDQDFADGMDFYSVDLVDEPIDGRRQVMHGSIWAGEGDEFQFPKCEGHKNGEACEFDWGVENPGRCSKPADELCISAVLEGVRPREIMKGSPTKSEYTYGDYRTVVVAEK